jgi:hypothetical protein
MNIPIWAIWLIVTLLVFLALAVYSAIERDPLLVFFWVVAIAIAWAFGSAFFWLGVLL